MKVRRKIILLFLVALSSVMPTLGAPRTDARHDPVVEITQKVQYGTASWYGAHWQGRRMAGGEPFNQNALIAAHRTLPLGTTVRVTNIRNGRAVTVRIKDRGPYWGRRIIDLSKAAATRIGIIHNGVASVKIQVVTLPHACPDGPLGAQNGTETR